MLAQHRDYLSAKIQRLYLGAMLEGGLCAL
jgi:hypothetical protein